MPIIPQAALTTAQIVGALAASAKNAVELAKSTSNQDVKAALSELYDSVLDVKARVLDLDEENRHLKDELIERAKYVGPIAPHGYYFQTDKPEHPLCPRCFQSSPRIIAFLKRPFFDDDHSRYERQCQICRKLFYDQGLETDKGRKS